MKKMCVIISLSICLSLTTVKPQTDQYYDELIQYPEKVIQTTAIFEQKYGNHSWLECTTCRKEKLTHGDFLGLVLMHAMAAFLNPKKPNPAKKILDEALEIFPQKNLAELIPFMLNAANTLPLICLRCHEKCWALVENKK